MYNQSFCSSLCFSFVSCFILSQGLCMQHIKWYWIEMNDSLYSPKFNLFWLYSPIQWFLFYTLSLYMRFASLSTIEWQLEKQIIRMSPDHKLVSVIGCVTYPFFMVSLKCTCTFCDQCLNGVDGKRMNLSIVQSWIIKYTLIVLWGSYKTRAHVISSECMWRQSLNFPFSDHSHSVINLAFLELGSTRVYVL